MVTRGDDHGKRKVGAASDLDARLGGATVARMAATSRRRRKRGEPTRLGDLVRQTPPGKAAAAAVVSRQVWEAVAGVGFARRTMPTRVDRGVLWVEVSSSGWAQELALSERVLVERLRARGIEVEKLRCVVRDVPRPERGGVYAPTQAALTVARELELPADAARAVAKVRDPDLRAAIAKLGRAVARRQAEVDLKREAASVERAIPRVPSERARAKAPPKP